MIDKIVKDSYNLMGIGMQTAGAMLKMNPFTERIGTCLTELGRPIVGADWHTPNRVVYVGQKVKLRKFTNGRPGTPKLIVPPETGDDSTIVDYGKAQSLVEACIEHTDGDIYVIEKLPAGPEHADYGLDEMVIDTVNCIHHCGTPVHLIGMCQGGWQAAIVAARFPHLVEKLVLGVAPIDYRKGNGALTQIVDGLMPEFFEAMSTLDNGNMPGTMMRLGFMMLDPYGRFVSDFLQLYINVDNPKFISRYHRFRQWFYNIQPIPGKYYREIIKELFTLNKLIKGELVILGEKVDLSNIECPVYWIAAKDDKITLIQHLGALCKHISSRVVKGYICPGGHVGAFMGTKPIKYWWPQILQDLRGA